MSAKDIELLEDIQGFFDDRGDGAPDSSQDARRLECQHNRPAAECVFCDPVGLPRPETTAEMAQRLANLCDRHKRRALPPPTVMVCGSCETERAPLKIGDVTIEETL